MYQKNTHNQQDIDSTAFRKTGKTKEKKAGIFGYKSSRQKIKPLADSDNSRAVFCKGKTKMEH